MSTLVKAGHVQTCCPRPAADVLQAHPNSPYTAFLATEQDFVESYDQHCARLVEGMSTLIACDSLERRESWNVCLLQQDVHLKLRSGVKMALSALRANKTSQNTAMPVMVTVLIDNRPEAIEHWDVVVHAAPFKQTVSVSPIEVAIVAPARLLPNIKHTNWVISRQQYANLVPSSAAEGILCSQDGQLLEGFISNLFIVYHDYNGLVVKTATKGVLAGIKQQQVLAACKALEIPTKCQAPWQTERHLWVEAFLTNAVRGLRPISKVCCPSNNAFGWEPWEHQLPLPDDQSVCVRVQRYLDLNSLHTAA